MGDVTYSGECLKILVCVMEFLADEQMIPSVR